MNRKLIWGLFLLLALVLTVPITTAEIANTAAWQLVSGPYGGSVAALAISPTEKTVPE